jgi:hypothetical protein
MIDKGVQRIIIFWKVFGGETPRSSHFRQTTFLNIDFYTEKKSAKPFDILMEGNSLYNDPGEVRDGSYPIRHRSPFPQ